MKVEIRSNQDDWFEIVVDGQVVKSGHDIRVHELPGILEMTKGHTEVVYDDQVDFD